MLTYRWRFLSYCCKSDYVVIVTSTFLSTCFLWNTTAEYVCKLQLEPSFSPFRGIFPLVEWFRWFFFEIQQVEAFQLIRRSEKNSRFGSNCIGQMFRIVYRFHFHLPLLSHFTSFVFSLRSYVSFFDLFECVICLYIYWLNFNTLSRKPKCFRWDFLSILFICSKKSFQ